MKKPAYDPCNCRDRPLCLSRLFVRQRTTTGAGRPQGVALLRTSRVSKRTCRGRSRTWGVHERPTWRNGRFTKRPYGNIPLRDHNARHSGNQCRPRREGLPGIHFDFSPGGAATALLLHGGRMRNSENASFVFVFDSNLPRPGVKTSERGSEKAKAKMDSGLRRNDDQKQRYACVRLLKKPSSGAGRYWGLRGDPSFCRAGAINPHPE